MSDVDRQVQLNFRGQTISLDRPLIMGVVNVTPDSFSDGGQFLSVEKATEHAVRLVEEGADILDIGGESTRPGADSVSVDEEISRVVPVIQMIRNAVSIPISIDTSKPEVMAAAIEAGASMINDINALQADGALEIASRYSDVPVCLMHMQGTPRTMQESPQYADVIDDVCHYLSERINACEKAGIERSRIIVDPGFGFGKTDEHNCALMAELNRLQTLGCPVLVGISRKSMIGRILDRAVDERLFGGLALTAISVWNGALIIRAHDVLAHRDAAMMAWAVRN